MIRKSAFAAMLLLGVGLLAMADESVDRQALLNGVKVIDAPGIPGPLCVAGEKAFVVLAATLGKSQQPVIAAGYMGKGRVVVFGHNGYFGRQSLAVADTGTLMLNAVRWAGGRASPRVGVRNVAGVSALLKSHGLESRDVTKMDLGGIEVLCLDVGDLSDADVAAIGAFVRGGGGLICASLGWGWQQLHPGKDLASDHPGNRLLAEAGIAWADGYLERTAAQGYAADPPPAASHAGVALDLLVANEKQATKLSKQELAQAAAVLSLAARSLAPGDRILLPELRKLAGDRTAVFPTPAKPLKESDALGRVLVTCQFGELNRLAPEQVKAHPAADAFPGAVPADAPRVSRTIEIDTSIPDWHSTGLYAPPGQLIGVEASQDASLHIRIGAHADHLWQLSSWSRFPEICRRWPIGAGKIQVASAFGGPIYIEAPSRLREPGESA